MSDTIQSRYASARQAVLRQQLPSVLIDAVESSADQAVLSQLPVTFHRGGHSGAYIIGSGATGVAFAKAITGSGRVVVLVDSEAATAGGELVDACDEYCSDTWQRWAKTTKAALIQRTPDSKPLPSAAARLRVERLTVLQATFGLAISELAQVLGITRQGLYKWLDASKDVKLQGAKQQRLASVERIGKKWRDRSTAPLSSVAREPLADGTTMLGLLLADNLDEAAATGAFDQLLAKLQAKSKSRSQKLADVGFTRRPSARSLPADE